MSCHEIGDLTIREFQELQQSFKAVIDLENSRFGKLCAAVYNSRRTSEDAPMLKPSDFFPSLEEQPEPQEEPEGVNTSALVLDDFWISLKSRSKVNKHK